MKAITEEQYEEMADKLETAIDSQTEYACEHIDAGNAYAHLFREGGWAYNNGSDRLKAWLLDHHGITLTESQFEELEDEALDWCDMEPNSKSPWTIGHIFSSGMDKNRFIVDSFAVGEVETQFCLSDLANMLGTEEETAREFSARAMEDNRFCLRENGDGGFLSYDNTDATWQGVITKEWLQDRLETITAED